MTAKLVTIEEALARILECVSALPAETVPLEEAAGRVLAEAARAQVDLPPFESSAMDGFAVRAADTPGGLPVALRIAAGRPARRALEIGEAMAIATGAVVPDGADAVVPIEDVVETDNTVEISKAASPGANVRPRGGDVAAGAVVVEEGVRIGPAQIGALAAAGVSEVCAGQRPRATVLTTGTELRAPGEPLGPGEVYEANGVMLGAQLASEGAIVRRLASVADDEGAHRRSLERGLESELLVTSGGVSVGHHDLVRRVESALGVRELFWGVAVKPGKPLSFGVREGTLVFGLPGNPVSSLVGFELFVRPAVRALQGARDPGPRYELGMLGRAVSRNAARDQLVRARRESRDGAEVLVALSGQESHMIARAASADALVHVPCGTGEIPAGSSVRFLPLG